MTGILWCIETLSQPWGGCAMDREHETSTVSTSGKTVAMDPEHDDANTVSASTESAGFDPRRVDAITESTFDALVHCCLHELRVQCLKLIAGRFDETLADEIVQATFETAWARRHTFIGGNARAWLYDIARKQAFYHIRKELGATRSTDDRLDTICPCPDEKIDGFRLLALIALRLEELDPIDADIVRLRFGLWSKENVAERGVELSYKEISRILASRFGQHVEPNTIRMRLQRFLERTAQWLDALDEADGETT